MMSLSEKWAHGLAANGVISQEDEALYSYGLRQGVVFLLNTAAIILVGWALGMVKESVVFMLSYLPLRRMAGGYHARTQLKCYLLGMVLTAGVLLAARWLPWNIYLCSGLLLAASAVIIWLAPVEDSNKPLDDAEKAHYGKRTRQILAGEIIAYIGLLAAGAPALAMTLAFSLTALEWMLVMGNRINCSNRIIKRRKVS